MADVNKKTTKCPYCGGLLRSRSVGIMKCSCCDSEFHIANDEKDVFDKAESLRLAYKFEEALELYEIVLKTDSASVEANWGALLSEFGVEYVKDGDKEIPTIHRPLYNYSIADDCYARAIFDNAFGAERDHYFVKIDELEKLRLRIEKEAEKYKRYDVFISCKITADAYTEDKTEEFEWANILYEELKKAGLEVFFSPYSLPSSNGDYEPVIYSALQSAKYLVVLASSDEHIDSTWVRNEWGRFLENSKNSVERKYFKPIVKNGMAKNLPAALKQTSVIVYDDKRMWLKNALDAVMQVFPERKSSPIIQPIDLKNIAKGKNRTLTPAVASTPTVFLIPQNPYTVKYRELDDVYTPSESAAVCIGKVETYLRLAAFSDAKNELKKYLSFFGEDTADFKILTLLLLADVKRKDISDFFENGLSEFNDFERLKQIINKTPKTEAVNFVNPLGAYVINSITTSSDDNAVEFYEAIKDVRIDEVTKLNYSVLRCLPHLYDKPALLMRYAQGAIPFVAQDNVEAYVSYVADLVAGMCRSGLWKECETLMADLIKADPANSKVLFVKMMIEKKARTPESLFEGIENSGDYIDVENFLPLLSEVGATHLAGVLRKRISVLLDKKKYNEAGEWVKILQRVTFDDKETFFSSVINRCRSDYKSVPAFWSAIHTLSEDRFGEFVDNTLYFINILIRNEQFAEAKRFCADLLQYDGDNVDCRKFALYAEIESSTYSFENVYKIKDAAVVEGLLISVQSEFERNEILRKLIAASVKYISNVSLDKFDKNIFDVFNRLLAYYDGYEDNLDIKKEICAFGNGCLRLGSFEKAKWYYVLLIRADKSYHPAYWGILLADNCCRNNADAVNLSVRIDSFKEYTYAMMYAKGNEAAENEYAEVLIRQKLALAKRRKKYVPLVVTGIAVIVVVVLFFVLK